MTSSRRSYSVLKTTSPGIAVSTLDKITPLGHQILNIISSFNHADEFNISASKSTMPAIIRKFIRLNPDDKRKYASMQSIIGQELSGLENIGLIEKKDTISLSSITSYRGEHSLTALGQQKLAELNRVPSQSAPKTSPPKPKAPSKG